MISKANARRAASKLKKFINDHIFGTVLTALASLAVTVGGYLLVAIKTDLDQLQCRIGQFGARSEYKSVQLKLIVTPLDDVNRNSEPFKDLVSIIGGYRSSLAKCSEGKSDLAEMDNYRLGLEGYFDRDWDKAFKHFELITERTALTEKSTANVLLHQYLALKKANDPKAADINRKWLARIAAAHDLAAKEAESTAKERAVAYLGCAPLFVDAPADEAISCLRNLVEAGQATYGVHYNLAALYARKGSFDVAIKHMEQCMKMPGAFHQRRADIEGDSDFKQMFGDRVFGPRLKNLLTRLRP